MTRIGILGAARIANMAMVLPANESEEAEVVAVATRDVSKAREFADQHGIEHAVEGYEALIARDDIDLIYNALPPSRHADLSIAALQSGKHVLCEKPFCMSADEARAMVEAAKVNGRFLIEAFHYRFHPAFARLRSIVTSGKLGPVVRYEGAFCFPIADTPGELRYDRALGGGAMMDLGVYPLHAIRTLEASEPKIVSATAQSGVSGVDLALEADLAFASGAQAHIACDMREGAESIIRLEVTCERGVVEMTNFIAPQFGHSIAVMQADETQTETVDDGTTYGHQLRHVLDVLAGRCEPLTGGEDAIAMMQAVDSIYAKAGYGDGV